LVNDAATSQAAQQESVDRMIWQGKAFGALLGVLTGGPVGALFGAALGHMVDVQAQAKWQTTQGPPLDAVGVQEAFFRSTFQVMGHLAKADGRVSEDEIRAARAMMVELQLGEREVKLAMALFTQGKAADFPLDSTLRQLLIVFRTRPDLCRMFVQIQLQAALWGDGLNAPTRRMLMRICGSLDISAYELVQMEALLRMQRSTRQPGAQPAGNRLSDAYAVIGVAATATDAEVTKAYRRMMSQNHPDKLHAKGLPEPMMKVAHDKTRQILTAYEVICAARGIR
jgi:DnaJ like chaperone protein